MLTDSKRLARSFNYLAPFYNLLKKVFLGNKPEEVISKSIPLFAYSDSIAIVGGGADNSIIELFKGNKCNSVTHIDVSSKMSSMAANRLSLAFPEKLESVSFVVKPFLDFYPKRVFSSVLFPFYLDLYTDEEVLINIRHARKMLAKNGLIYVVDFTSTSSGKKIQMVKIKTLYRLFQPFTNVFRNRVPDYQFLFTQNGFKPLQEQSFYKDLYTLHVFKLTS